MVLATCRRLLREPNDAEDAFQATFLVLAKKAGAVRRPGRLAGWLHGVALRVAARARAETHRRRARETPLADVPAPAAADGACPADAGRALDEELARLPERYRAPLVLCYLEGHTYAEAARRLGWAAGTVSGRLARARALLRRRLTLRGLSPGVALLVLDLTVGADAAVPEGVVGETVAAVAAGVGRSVGATRGAALAVGVTRAMLMTRVKTAAVVALLALAATGLLGLRVGGAPPAATPPPAAPAAAGAGVAGKKADNRKPPARERSKRMLRWSVDLSTAGKGVTLGDLLPYFGAAVAFPETPEAKRYRVVWDLTRRPVRGEVEDLQRLDRIDWLDGDKKNVRSLAERLGLNPAPDQLIVLFPPYVEDVLLH
jgi:RNA polymerase sigma factor (sigma-70 family)